MTTQPMLATRPAVILPLRSRSKESAISERFSSGALVVLLLASYLGAWRNDGWWEFGIWAAAAASAALLVSTGGLRWRRAGVAAIFAVPACLGWLQCQFSLTASIASTQAQTIRWAGAAAFCSLAAAAVGAGRRALWLDGLSTVGAALAVLAGLQAFSSQGAVFWWVPTPLPSVFGPFLNRNHFAAFCELLLPVAAWRAVERPGWRRWPPVAIAVAGILGGSRAGIALLTLEVTVMIAWAASPRAGLSRIRSLGWVLTALAGVPLLALALGGEPLAQRLRESEPLLYRDQIWAASIDLVRERPWVGHGLGTFSLVYPAVARFDTGEVVHRAHCDWLEWWVEGGVLFPLSWAILLGWTCRRALSMPWLAGVPAILIHSVVDYPLDRFVLLALVGLLITMSAGAVAPQKRLQKPHRGV